MKKALFRLLPLWYLPLILLNAAVLAWRPLFGGVDFWAHAAIGRWIWQHGAVPHETLFLWGQAPQPWVYHSWLSQLTFYALMTAGGDTFGPYLALLLTAMVVVATYFLIWQLWRKHANINALTPLLFSFALWIASARFNPRPELFSSLFLTVLLVYLAQRHEKKSAQTFAAAWQHEKWRIFGLAMMFALWANFHGGVAQGLLILCLTLLCDSAQDRGSASTRSLGLLLLLCIIAINFNPYGISYWAALKPVGGEMFALIDEWKPVWREPAMPLLALVFPGVLFMLAFGGWAQNPGRRWSHLAWLLAALALMLSARRNLWTFSQVCLIVMATNAMAFDTTLLWNKWLRKEGVPSRIQLAMRIGVVSCLAFWLASYLPSSLRATSPTLPIRATQFVKEKKLTGRFFVDYLHTSYWQWQFAGSPAPYIDLLNAYDARLLSDYFEILRARPQGARKLAALQPDYIFFGPYEADSRLVPLATFLDSNPQWNALYRQKDGTLWKREKSQFHDRALGTQ